MSSMHCTSAKQSMSAASYGYAEHHEKLAESLAYTGANETQLRGRLAAARSEGTHSGEAVSMGKGTAKDRRTRSGATVGAERTKSGPLDSRQPGRSAQ